MAAADERAVVLVTPLAPARTGNGLAMRAGVLLESLAAGGPVDLVVIPVSGPAAPLAWARALARRVEVVDPVTDADAARAHLDRQLGDPWLRDRLQAAAPLPTAARAVPPGLADTVDPPAGPVAAVVGLRVTLAPVTVALARRLGVAAVVDADDDDVGLLQTTGETDAAAATERLCRAWLPESTQVWAAGAPDARTMADRYGVAVRTVPNAVRVPGPAGPAPAGGAGLLFVGNLTYAPNVDAARVLATQVLPRVRAERPDATLTLVGPAESGVLDDLAADPAVRIIGPVPEVAPWYHAASVVVVPLRLGAGTRIKVLEAAAHGRPVVASTKAVAGLTPPAGAVTVVDGADATAREVCAVLADPTRAAAMTVAARDWVEEHSVARVGSRIRRAVTGGDAAPEIVRQVLWHDLEVAAPREVLDALDAVLPTASRAFPAGTRFRYSVEPTPAGGYRVLEDADPVATVASPTEARDVVHARFHRRVFERASRAGWLRVHGALIDVGSVRVLCTGPEGAGKSTLALRALIDGLGVQGDESVVLRGRDAIAVARPLHCKPGAEAAVPELADAGDAFPVVDGIRIVDPGRLGHPWTIARRPVDHVVVLEAAPAGDGPVGLRPAGHTEVLPDLVDALFPVTESKPVLLRALAGALAGVGAHRLSRTAPERMVQALRELG